MIQIISIIFFSFSLLAHIKTKKNIFEFSFLLVGNNKENLINLWYLPKKLKKYNFREKNERKIRSLFKFTHIYTYV